MMLEMLPQNIQVLRYMLMEYLLADEVSISLAELKINWQNQKLFQSQSQNPQNPQTAQITDLRLVFHNVTILKYNFALNINFYD